MVGKIEIFYSHDVADFIESLAHILHKKEYFGFIEDANNYVDKIVFKLETNIHKLKHNTTDNRYKMYRKYYVVITSNKQTAWHVYFDKKGNTYIVNKIENNHLPSAKFLND